jgi:hypothetical protein
MSTIHHSEETHANLVARLSGATGRDADQWVTVVESGPAFSRFEERVHWLQDEYELPHSYATAVAHEYDLKRAARRIQ